MPGFPVLQQLPEFTQTHVHRVGNAFQPSHPLSSPSPLTLNLSQHQGLFKWVSFSHQVAKVLGVSALASVLPMNIQWLISFKIDWLDLLAVQGTLKSLLQHRSLKASIPRCPAFFMVQFLHPYMTTGKSIVLTIQTLIGKVMCLLFNTLSRFVIAFLPRSKCLDFEAAVTVHSDFGAPKIKVCHCFHFYCPFYLPWNDGTGCLHTIDFTSQSEIKEV